jgi:hypothetical protein
MTLFLSGLNEFTGFKATKYALGYSRLHIMAHPKDAFGFSSPHLRSDIRFQLCRSPLTTSLSLMHSKCHFLLERKFEASEL